MITYIALKVILLYQRYISPYKGFSCSFRLLTKEGSCSQYGAKVIKRFGFFTGYKLLKRRFEDCAWASNVLNKNSSYLSTNLKYKNQRGVVDCLDCLDIADCCDIPDCGKKKDTSEKRDKKNRSKYLD